jgi:hypothetical protein
MKRQFKLIIPCYFETEETLQYEKMHDKVADKSMYGIFDVTIYERPYAICPHFENNIEIGSRLYVNNEYFISTLKVNELEILIESELEQ